MTQSVEDYLKTVYALAQEGVVSVGDISVCLGVAPSSVTKMLKRLVAMELVRHDSYKAVSLTEKGSGEALKIIRRHRLLELFLVKVLDYSWDEVHEEACNLEHYISDKLEDRISDMLGDPVTDPHGELIPGKDGRLPESKAVPLTEIDAGTSFIVSSVNDALPEMLKYFGGIGLVPGQKAQLLEKQPFGGSYKIRLKRADIFLGLEAVAHMRVVPGE